eukprot:366012-Chlamydomonas_euryale.AAC.6
MAVPMQSALSDAMRVLLRGFARFEPEQDVQGAMQLETPQHQEPMRGLTGFDFDRCLLDTTDVLIH